MAYDRATSPVQTKLNFEWVEDFVVGRVYTNGIIVSAEYEKDTMLDSQYPKVKALDQYLPSSRRH